MHDGAASERPIIGVVLPWLGSADHVRILEGCRRVADAAGYTVVAFHAGYEGDHVSFDEAFGRSMGGGRRRTVAAWVVTNIFAISTWTEQQLAAGLPVVQISPSEALEGCQRVLPDNVGGAQLATAHLLSVGRRAVAFIGHLGNQDISGRYSGYCAALHAGSIAIERALTVSIDWRQDYWTARGGAEAVERLLASGVHFDALFAATDELAAGGITALLRAGRSIPGDVAVAGFDDALVARTTIPPITTVRQSFLELGERATELALRQVRGERVSSGIYYSPARLIVRQSTVGIVEEPADVARAALPLREQLIEILDARRSNLVVGIDQLVEQFAAAAAGDGKQTQQLLGDLLPVIGRSVDDQQQLAAALALLRDAAPPQSAARAAQLADRAMQQLLDNATRDGLRQQQLGMQVATDAGDIVVALMGASRNAMVALEWLTHSTVRAGYLFLASPEQRSHDGGALDLVGLFDPHRASQLHSGMRLAADLPLGAILASHPGQMVSVYLVTSGERFYGALVLAIDEGDRALISSTAGAWVTQIGARLAMDDLIASLQQSRDSLAHAYEQERALALTVSELACPIMPVSDGVLVLPLIGSIDSRRAAAIIDVLLTAIGTHAADTVVIDITGVPVVDTSVAGYLLRAIQAAKLLGTEVLLTGIRPEIAQTMVQLGVQGDQFLTRASLADGLAAALKRKGLAIR